jgi:hypothetical protein
VNIEVMWSHETGFFVPVRQTHGCMDLQLTTPSCHDNWRQLYNSTPPQSYVYLGSPEFHRQLSASQKFTLASSPALSPSTKVIALRSEALTYVNGSLKFVRLFLQSVPVEFLVSPTSHSLARALASDKAKYGTSQYSCGEIAYYL